MDEKEWTISIQEKLEKELDTQKYEIPVVKEFHIQQVLV